MITEILQAVIAQGGDICSIIATIAVCAMLPHIKKLGHNDVAILRSKLKELGHELLEQGYVTDEDAIEFDSLYDCYRDMGGNSFVVELAERVHHLPLKK